MKNLVKSVSRFGSRRRLLLTAAMLLSALAFGGLAKAQDPLKVAFVYVGPVSDAGWTHQHDLGRQAVEAEFGDRINVRTVDKVAEGPDSERVIRDLASQGYELIFTTSFGFMDPTIKVAREFPAVRFEHASGYKSSANVGNYNARFYEGRYLSGMAAGAVSKTNTLGYVATLPIPEVIQGINAFMLGARQTNPDSILKIIWINAWFDPGREAEAANTLIDAGADVLTHHTGSSAVPRTAEARKTWVVGYHSDMRAAAPSTHLVSVTHHWGHYYIERINAVLAGRWKSESVWGGMNQGFVRLQGLSDQVPAALRTRLVAAEQALKAGQRHPFTGPLQDNDGQARLPAGEQLSDAQIGQMNWFVNGVSGKVPR